MNIYKGKRNHQIINFKERKKYHKCGNQENLKLLVINCLICFSRYIFPIFGCISLVTNLYDNDLIIFSIERIKEFTFHSAWFRKFVSVHNLFLSVLNYYLIWENLYQVSFIQDFLGSNYSLNWQYSLTSVWGIL